VIMKIQKLLVFFGAILSLAVGHGHAQTTLVEQEGVVLTRSLSGHVDAGTPKVPVKAATVELCSSDWKTVLASTKTDDSGYFSLDRPAGKLFYIRVSSPGLNPFQLRVRVSKHVAHDLTIDLIVATWADGLTR